MSANKVIQKIVITPDAGETQDNAEPINAVITNENGDSVATVDQLPYIILPDQTTITDEGGSLSVKLSREPGHKNITTEYGGGLSVSPASLPRDFALPEEAGATVTPEQFNKLLLAIKELLDGLKAMGFIELTA